MKPRLAFVDNSFHKKTQSGNFLRELFSFHFDVVDLWDDSWKRSGGSMPVDGINQGDFSHVVFFQSMPTIDELRRLRPWIVWVPMYDSVMGWNRGGDFWAALMDLPIKIICFCRELYTILNGRGFNCVYVQYFTDPSLFPAVADYRSNRIFFWQRRLLTFTQVKQIIGENSVDQCTVKLDPDPGFLAARLAPEDIERYKVTRLINGAIGRTEYLDLLQQSNIFIAPRKYEGIGMSFLEAMSMGMVVVGLNQPTLSEYVRHGENGLLFDEKNMAIEISDIERIGRCARMECEQGFLRWQEEKHLIVQYILESTN